MSMELAFAAMRGTMGKRDYYVAMVKLKLVPRLFQFRDWSTPSPSRIAQQK